VLLAVVVVLSVLCFFLMGGLVCAVREIDRLVAALDREKFENNRQRASLASMYRYSRIPVVASGGGPVYVVEEGDV
jgi:hypothetical protein